MTDDTMQSKAIILTEVTSNQKILMIKANVFLVNPIRPNLSRLQEFE